MENSAVADISADGKYLLLQSSRFDAQRAPFNRTSVLRMDAYTGQVDTLLNDTLEAMKSLPGQ